MGGGAHAAAIRRDVPAPGIPIGGSAAHVAAAAAPDAPALGSPAGGAAQAAAAHREPVLDIPVHGGPAPQRPAVDVRLNVNIDGPGAKPPGNANDKGGTTLDKTQPDKGRKNGRMGLIIGGSVVGGGVAVWGLDKLLGGGGPSTPSADADTPAVTSGEWEEDASHGTKGATKTTVTTTTTTEEVIEDDAANASAPPAPLTRKRARPPPQEEAEEEAEQELEVVQKENATPPIKLIQRVSPQDTHLAESPRSAPMLVPVAEKEGQDSASGPPMSGPLFASFGTSDEDPLLGMEGDAWRMGDTQSWGLDGDDKW